MTCRECDYFIPVVNMCEVLQYISKAKCCVFDLGGKANSGVFPDTEACIVGLSMRDMQDDIDHYMSKEEDSQPERPFR